MPDARRALVRILQLAYSGERAAGYAYRGHWRSVASPEEAARIQKIEAEVRRGPAREPQHRGVRGRRALRGRGRLRAVPRHTNAARSAARAEHSRRRSFFSTLLD